MRVCVAASGGGGGPGGTECVCVLVRKQLYMCAAIT